MKGPETSFNMNEEVIIRKIQPGELDRVIALANDIWPATYKKILSSEQITYMMEMMYSKAALQTQMLLQQHQFLLCEWRNRDIAFASWSISPGVRLCKLHKIYVHPDMQGKHIGEAIISFIWREMEKENAPAIELNVNRNNPAKGFYEKLGFRVTREEDIDIGNGYFMNDYVMRKEVSG
jgi:ribosomal protein S18 acetylase RimI-like enzyme